MSSPSPTQQPTTLFPQFWNGQTTNLVTTPILTLMKSPTSHQGESNGHDLLQELYMYTMKELNDETVQVASKECSAPKYIKTSMLLAKASNLTMVGGDGHSNNNSKSKQLLPRPTKLLLSDSELLNINEKQESNIIDSNLVKCMIATQKSLARFVQTPKLHLFYLQRPPFLFMHDIISCIIRKHGFLSGLFTIKESDRFVAKQSFGNRLRFFKKLVGALKSTTGEPFPIPSNSQQWSKLTKGVLPFYSNWILQTIGYALEKGMNSDLAVKQICSKFHSKKSNKKSSHEDLSPYPYCYSEWKSGSHGHAQKEQDEHGRMMHMMMSTNASSQSEANPNATIIKHSKRKLVEQTDYEEDADENPRKYKIGDASVDDPDEDEDYGSDDCTDDEEDDGNVDYESESSEESEESSECCYCPHQQSFTNNMMMSDQSMTVAAVAVCDEPMDFS